MTRRILAVLAALALCAGLSFAALADTDAPGAPDGSAARELSVAFDAWGSYDYSLLSDDSVATHVEIGYGDTLTVIADEPIAGAYLKFYVAAAAWTLEANDRSADCGQHGFVHEYVDVAAAVGETTSLALTFPRGADAAELLFFSAGTLPDYVQTWEAPLDGRADLVMFSSHADDEQLFFSGVLPDAVARGAACEVVYFCDHSGEPQRVHEQLNGLWAVGVRNYPVLGKFPDLYSESKEGGEAAFAAQGYTEDDFLEWQVENIRRFRPQILVIHDEAGEYGHGTHIINSATARDAVSLAADTAEYPYSLAAYGAWDTPKVYMHLYAENAITLDFDRPLEYFGGKTAYEMSCLGFAEHKSQHWTWFYKWMYGIEQEQSWDENAPRFTSAAQITSYSPCAWGLWRSLVGSDTANDMFDHITLYSTAPAEPVTETELLTEAPSESVTEALPAVVDDGGEKSDYTAIIVVSAIAAAALIVIVIAIRASRRAKRKREEQARRDRRAAQARRLREAREEQARAKAAGRAPGYGQGRSADRPLPDTTSSIPPNARAEAIRAARAARAAAGRRDADHTKPGDRKY